MLLFTPFIPTILKRFTLDPCLYCTAYILLENVLCAHRVFECEVLPLDDFDASDRLTSFGQRTRRQIGSLLRKPVTPAAFA